MPEPGAGAENDHNGGGSHSGGVGSWGGGETSSDGNPSSSPAAGGTQGDPDFFGMDPHGINNNPNRDSFGSETNDIGKAVIDAISYALDRTRDFVDLASRGLGLASKAAVTVGSLAVDVASRTAQKGGHLEVPLDFGFRRLGALGSSGCAFCSLIFG
jgi:hypothetical protein